MAEQISTLKRYDFYRGAQALGDVWTLHRGELELRCALATHRLGWELRLTVGENFLRSEVCKSETEVLDVVEAWRAEAEAKGWMAGRQEPARSGDGDA